MQHRVLKYLLDIESVIQEIEMIKATSKNDFSLFVKDIILQRAVERDLEIIGEAIKKLLEADPVIEISSARKIIGLRNIISHAYDSVESELIWGIIQKDIPALAMEVREIISGQK